MSFARLRSLLAAAAIALVAAGVVNTATSGWDSATKLQAFDFEINWVAAHRLLDGEPLYDQNAARAEGIERIGPSHEFLYTSTFSSYIGPPSTALFYVPFTPFSHDAAVDLFRLAEFLAMVGAVVLMASLLPRGTRGWAALLGVGVLLVSTPVNWSIRLGQVDGWVVLGLAVGIWALVRGHARWAGVALGIAVMLKLSPVLVLGYLLLRGPRRAVWSALATIGAFLALAAAIGRPDDLWIWLRDVAPDVGRGSIQLDNQSLPGWVARMVTGRFDILTEAPLGGWRWLGWLAALAAVWALWRYCRSRPFDPLELGIVVTIAVVAAPLAWDFYVTWALVAFVLLFDVERWTGRSRRECTVLAALLAVSVALSRPWLQSGTSPTPEQVADQPLWRVASGPRTVVLLIWLGVAVWMILRSPAVEDRAPAPAPAAFPDPAPAHAAVDPRPDQATGTTSG